MADEKLEKDPVMDVEETLSKAEQYIEQNQKSLLVIVAALVVLVGGYFGWKTFYLDEAEKEAAAAMFKAEKYFEMDSLDLAINGKGEVLGFQQIVDEYGITSSGNLAEYYLGVCYLKKGEFEKAIEHLGEYDGKDQIVASIATGGIGDANIELGNADKAISFYIRAAEQHPNKFTSPIYLKKAALAYEDKGEYENAIKLYEQIRSDYFSSDDAKDIEKYIARAKAKKN